MNPDDLLKKKCNSIFSNLLMVKDVDPISSAYIRKFFQTDRCDKVKDMSPYRNEYKTFINSADSTLQHKKNGEVKDDANGRLERILTFNENEKDEKIANQAFLHYHTWHKTHLVSALNWPSYVYFHTIHRAERTVANTFEYIKKKF